MRTAETIFSPETTACKGVEFGSRLQENVDSGSKLKGRLLLIRQKFKLESIHKYIYKYRNQ